MAAAFKLSESLAAGMWTVALMIIFFNVLLIIMGWPRKKENSVNALLLYYILVCNLLTAIFVVLLASIDNGIKDSDGTDEKYRPLCSLCGYIGLAAWLLSLSAMITMAANLLLRFLVPGCFKQGKNYVPKMRGIILIQGLVILAIVVVPFLPLDVFESGQNRTRNTHCLPLHPPQTPMWEVTLVLYIVESVGVFVLFLLCAMMLCHLSRQRNIIVSAIPMEARVLRRNSHLVKRQCCVLLGNVLFWVPPLLTLLCMFAGVHVSDSVLQWMFGVVHPFGSVAGPFLYLLRVTCKNYTFSSCIKGTRSKVAKTRDAVQLQIDRITGAITIPQKMDAYKVPNGNHTSSSLESIPTPHQKSKKHLNAPPVVHWVETVPIIGRHMNMNFGIVEWQTKNGSPRRGLLKIFTKPHSREWRNESSILYRLSRLEHHRNIVEYLWHSKSSQTKLERGQTEPSAEDREKPVIQRFICTAYYQHGTLRDFLHSHPRSIQESHVHAIATQVAAGMAYLHAMSIVHGLMETTSVLIGGHIETMAIKVVIANFSRATDLTQRPVSTDLDSNLQKEDAISNAPSTTLANMPGSVLHQEKAAHQSQVPDRLLFSGDVRSFALLLLEMIAWLKMIRVPDDGPSVNQTKSWTLDRKSRRGVTRGWTLTPFDGKACLDYQCHVAGNRNTRRSVDYCGSDVSNSDDLMVAQINTLNPENPSWEEIETFPRRTKQNKVHHMGGSSSDRTLENQSKTFSTGFYNCSDSSGCSSQKTISNGVSMEEEVKRSLAQVTEDGSCCIVNPYFDMMASDDELKENPPSTKEIAQLGKAPSNLTCKKTFEKSREQTKCNDVSPKAAERKRKIKLGFDAEDSQSSKRDSLCSLDSGISSHQSSMRSSSSDQMGKRCHGASPRSRTKYSHPMPRRQKLINQSALCGSFESSVEGTNGVCSANNNIHQQTDQNVEAWVENHTVHNGHHNPGHLLSRANRSKPRVPETLQEVESPDQPRLNDLAISTEAQIHNKEKQEAKNQCRNPNSKTADREAVTDGEEIVNEMCSGKSKVPVARSASSLSQFYIRKRAPRPHNITIIPGSTSTLPANLQRRSIHAPDSPRLLEMTRGRPSSCHGQMEAKKSNSLDSASSTQGGDSTDNSCCASHSQCSPDNFSTSTLARQSRSLEDSCLSHMPVQLKLGTGTVSNTKPPQGVPATSLRKLHRQDAILESISELSSRTTHHPQLSHSFEDKLSFLKRPSQRSRTGPGPRRFPTTGISQQHVNFCQELQALLPCLPKVVLDFWWKQQGCGQAVLQWIDSLKDYDGCLHSQLIGILESCWGKEPALPSSEVHLMLDNCLTEVAL